MSALELNKKKDTLLNIEMDQPLPNLVLFQELQLDGDIVAHSLVFLAVDLELLLGLLNLGQGVCITWPQI